MNAQGTAREVFRRSPLTILPEWFLAGSVSLAVGLAARHLGLQGGWEAPALAGLPILWAGGRSLQWLCRTWTATADGLLVARKGVLFHNPDVLHLCSVSDFAAGAPVAARLLDVGDIAFEATNERGRRCRFRWTWMGGHGRLCQIIHARGRLPIGAPDRWQPLRHRVREGARATVQALVYALKRAEMQDYGRFMAFCRHLLRVEQGGRWPPARPARATVECWLAVLWHIHVVAEASNERGWRVAPGINSLDGIRRRLGPDDLKRAVRQAARFHPQWGRAA